MRRVIILFLLFSITHGLIAQSKALKKGVKKIKRGEFELAIAHLEKHTDDRQLAGESNYYIGESYRLSNRIREAEEYYRRALDRGYSEPEVYFHYAFALKSNGKYKEARRELEKFLNVAENQEMIEHARLELQNLDKIDEILARENYYRVKNLDEINTKNAEYSPIYNDGFLYFTSNRQSDRVYKATGTGFTDIYRVQTEGAVVSMSTLEPLNEQINLFGVNEGSVTFTPDGKTMVFARGNSGKKKGNAEVNLFISYFRNRAWSEPRILNINVPGAWDSCPAFSANGRILYFASNREGGEGGIDLYSANMDRRGRFSHVRNLGPEINTPGDEMFPYVADDGRLFFSSTGHPSLGGLDIFVATRENGQTKIENLGPPINTISDDFGYFLYKVDRGFLSSNRDEGKGDDDIFTFINQDPDLKIVNYYLAGVTKTRDDEGNEDILPNVQVTLFRNEGDTTLFMDEVTTDSEGKFRFRVNEHENYVLLGEKIGGDVRYFTTRMDYTTVGKSIPQEELTDLVTNVTLDTVLILDKIVIDKAIVLENIYYDFGRWEIRPDAAQELDKLVNILIDNPEIMIELSSHTDSVDTRQYNQRLSQRRAEAAVDYIVFRGINPNRIIARGYGEERPIAPNTNPDGTDNPEGRQKNRRTEFKVIRINESGDEEDFFDEDRFFDDDGEEDDTGN